MFRELLWPRFMPMVSSGLLIRTSRHRGYRAQSSLLGRGRGGQILSCSLKAHARNFERALQLNHVLGACLCV